MRLPYVPDPPDFASASDRAIVDRIKQRRGERGLISLDKALLHSPPVADGWYASPIQNSLQSKTEKPRNSLLGAIRTSTTLSASIRETAICRVAVLNRAWYEFESHAPILLKEGGLPVGGVKYIVTSPTSSSTHKPHSVDTGAGIDEKHALVLEYTDYMTLSVEVPDEMFEQLRKVFSERETVEITATIGTYNCVSRFLVALNVSERNGVEGMKEALKHVSPDLEGAEPVST